IEKNNQGIEVFGNFNYKKYNIDYATMPNSSRRRIGGSRHAMFGINYHYNKVYQSKYLEINPFAGLNYGLFSIDEITFSPYSPSGWGEYPGAEDTAAFGLQAGINIHAPIWRRFYANSNLRYTVIP